MTTTVFGKQWYKIRRYSNVYKTNSPYNMSHWEIDMKNPSIYNIITLEQAFELCPYISRENTRKYLHLVTFSEEPIQMTDNGHVVYYVPCESVSFT